MSANKYKRKYQKLRDSACGEDCTFQIFPYCNQDLTKTSLCHLPSGSGWGQKSPDWFAAYGCSDCHDIIDGRRHVVDVSDSEKITIMQRALFRTWERMMDKGLIKI